MPSYAGEQKGEAMSEQGSPESGAGSREVMERALKRTERFWNFAILGGFLVVFLVWGTAGAAFAVMAIIVLCLLVLLAQVIGKLAKPRAGSENRPGR